MQFSDNYLNDGHLLPEIPGIDGSDRVPPCRSPHEITRASIPVMLLYVSMRSALSLLSANVVRPSLQILSS